MHAGTGRIYLDYNASAPLVAEARDAFVGALDMGANPSSVHRDGRRARALVEEARREVASLVGYPADGVVFTSGASEAAATCLVPFWLEGPDERPIRHLAVLDTDHPCVREGGRFDRDRIVRLPVDIDGVVDAAALDVWLRSIGHEPAILALGLANNETGVVQPLPAFRAAVERPSVTIVLDAVQAVGRIVLADWFEAADIVLLSGHKIGAATGVGAFVLKSDARRPFPLIRGGGQESYRRAGTEAVPAIASFGAAAARARQSVRSEPARLVSLQARLEARLDAAGAIVLGRGAARLPNTTLVHDRRIAAETAQIALDLQGFSVSAGSACSSGKVGASHVLAALATAGAPIDVAAGALRISTGQRTTVAEIDAFADACDRLLSASMRGDRKVA